MEQEVSLSTVPEERSQPEVVKVYLAVIKRRGLKN